MSQSRFSIVLVGVSALLRRPLVSRLRPADGERLPWVAFTARRCLPFRLFGMRRFGVALGELVLLTSASEIAARRVGFRAHCSAFRHAPLRGCRSVGWFFCLPFRSGRWASSFFRLPLRKLPSAGWPSGSLLPLFGTHHFGVAVRRVGSSAGRVGLRAHCFRFSARAASEIALGGLVFPLGELVFGLTASAFRHAPLRSGRWASSFFRLPFRRLPSAGWPSGSPLPLFGMRRSAPPRCRSEDRRSTTTRQLFHFKTLIPTC